MKQRSAGTLIEITKYIVFLAKRARELAEERRWEIGAGTRKRLPKETDKFLRGCIDCGQSCFLGGDYLVHDALWATANLNKREICCEDCLSKRIGRPLEITDYAQVIANLPRFRGYAMAMQKIQKEQQQ